MVQSACFVVRCAVFVHFHLFTFLTTLFSCFYPVKPILGSSGGGYQSEEQREPKWQPNEINQAGLDQTGVVTCFCVSTGVRLQKWLRHEIMRPWSAVQVIFLLYAPWGRSHSCWCFVACESEFTEWQPAAEELKINLLMANGGSSPCWHLVLQHARRARVCGSFGSGNVGNSNFMGFFAPICGLYVLIWVCWKPVCKF